MLSEIPIKIEKVEEKILNREILRAAMRAELDAISLYEQLVAVTEHETYGTYYPPATERISRLRESPINHNQHAAR